MESVAACRATRTLSDKQFIAYQTNAVLAGLLGRHWYQSDRHKADAAFAAGMLRDIGHFILAGNGREVGDAEWARHPAVSAYLLGIWGIPHPIMEAVTFHENPGAVEHPSLELVDVVHLADHVASDLAPSPFQRERPELDYAYFATLGVTREAIDAWRVEAARLTEQAREMLAL
jgi:HD-like signal output (HDOD) protein